MQLICIVCPMGCSLIVEIENETVVSVTGNTCPRGEKYAINECINPTRTLTTTVMVESMNVVSVKSDKPIPKDKIKEYMNIVNQVRLAPPISIGDIIIEKIDGEVNIVATKNIFETDLNGRNNC